MIKGNTVKSMKDQQKMETKKKQHRPRISRCKEFNHCFEYDSAFNLEDSKIDNQQKKKKLFMARKAAQWR